MADSLLTFLVIEEGGLRPPEIDGLADIWPGAAPKPLLLADEFKF